MPAFKVISIALMVSCALFGNGAAGDTYYVSICGDDAWSGAEPNCVGPNGPKATIQAAINAASGGDTVMVLPGTYTGVGNRDIDFGGKAITVQGSDPNNPEVVAATIIDCQSSGRGFIFDSSETSSSVLSGLTITNGIATYGGGIYCYWSSPTVIKCRIVDNHADDGGGGICLEGRTLAHFSPTVSHCIVEGNTATIRGGGIFCKAIRDGVIEHCTIVNNNSDDGGGGFVSIFYNQTISHCIVWGNTAEYDPQIGGSSTAEYCDVEGGFSGAGNIDADPVFVDEAGGDYHLSPDSPCINAGDPSFSAGAGQTDIDGDVRIVNGRVDIGADEFYSSEVLIGVSARVMEFHTDEGGPNPGEETLSIFNSGSGVFGWTLSEGCGWLEVEPTNGTCISGGDPCEVTVSVEVSGLEVGLHEGEIMVTSAEAANSPRIIKIYLSYGMELRNVPEEYNTIQAAINASSDNDVIMVAEGTYTGEGNRDLDFGGRAITVRSIDPYDPEVVAATIIDGESDYDECHDGLCERNRGFYFHNGEGEDSKVSGFTIANFCAPDVDYGSGGGPMPAGGGILCEYSSPTISYCIITHNWADQAGVGGIGGGGIHCQGGNPTITYCTISYNVAYVGGGGIDCGSATISQCTITDNYSGWSAGGIDCSSSTNITNSTISNNRGWCGGIGGSPTISNCTITGNKADYFGGGIYGSGSINNCIITDNVVQTGYGGGVYGTDTSLHIINSIIIGNSAHSGDDGFGGWIEGKGGGIYCPGGNISNCTITGNWAEFSGGGVYGNATITNSILWDDTAPNGQEITGNPTVSYSDVEGGWPGLGNINLDPLFADALNGDVHLQSQAGRWDSVSESWVYDPNTSPCIDAGDPVSNWTGELWPHGGRINMGAYGGTAQASMSLSQVGNVADLNYDGTVNLEDYALLGNRWARQEVLRVEDMDRNGIIDVRDLAILAGNWLWGN